MNRNLTVSVCAVALFILLLMTLFWPGAITTAKGQVDLSRVELSRAGSSFVAGRVLVRFQPGISSSRARALSAAAGARVKGEIPRTGVRVLELPNNANEEVYLRAIRSWPDVEFAELDRVLAPAEVVPNDPWYANWEWHLRKIACPTAWATTTGSGSVTIAICDTGVDGSHPDLMSKMVPGWNTYNNNSDTNDATGHGTSVAGTAAAASDNGVGVASVAWGCRIMPIRVSDASGYASYSTIASALTWAADHGARVANISYVVSGSSTVDAAASYFQNRGGVVTSSAGNYSTYDPSPDDPYILTVSATNSSDGLESYSNTGNNIDVAAPGTSFTTRTGGAYGSVAGTSFSAPIVAGVAALVLSANPGLTGSQAQEIVKQSADDLGSAGWDSGYGFGRVNAARAVSLATGGSPPDSTPPTVSFTSPGAGSTVSGVVTAQISASDNTGVASVSFSVDGALLGNDNAAPYTFSWDSRSVSNGAHNLTATAQDAAGNTATASISVTVSNSGSDTAPPTISITSPSDGAFVSGNVSVFVNAADNVAVTKVELYVDGALKSTATSAPFTTKWNTRKERSGSHRLQCKAYDAAGNTGLSQLVTVNK